MQTNIRWLEGLQTVSSKTYMIIIKTSLIIYNMMSYKQLIL